MGLPFVLVRSGNSVIPLFAGADQAHGLVGLDIVSLALYAYSPEDVVGAVSIEPASVFYGMEMNYAEGQREERRAAAGAAEAAKPIPRYAPKGYKFTPLPSEMVSGFPIVRSTLLRHRMTTPSIDTIRLSGLFAVSTVRTSIEQAEKSFNCFVELYEAAGRELPPVEAIKSCFRGLQNTKSRMFAEVAGYAPVIREAIARGLRDRALRRYLVTETDLPTGLGVSKTSFTLALLGHDCVCLDARLLGRMFRSRDEALRTEGGWGKNEKGRVSELALKRYEAVEDAFLRGNPYYDANDPIGRARAQWQSWESVGGAGATHSVWLRVVA
jgi:hypothetical protein